MKMSPDSHDPLHSALRPMQLSLNQTVLNTFADDDYSSNSSYQYEDETLELRGDWHDFALPAAYILLASSGLIGYGMVTCIIVHTVMAKCFIHVYVYICALSLIDIIFLLTTPITITHMLLKSWSYSQATCKFMFFCEGMHKTLSICLIVGLAGDRFVAVCFPLKFAYLRTTKASLIYIALCAISSSVVNFPLLWFAQLSNVWTGKDSIICGLQFPVLDIDISATDLVTNSPYFEAPNKNVVSSIWLSSGTYYIMFMCSIYYVFPGILVVFFSVRVARSVHKHLRFDSRERKSANSRSRVIKLVFSVVFLYFACWSPFWFLQLFIRLSGMAVADKSLAILAKIIYTLPLVNANMNALLYTFLNKCLRRAYRMSFRLTSMGHKTSEMKELQQQSERLLARRSAHTISL